MPLQFLDPSAVNECDSMELSALPQTRESQSLQASIQLRTDDRHLLENSEGICLHTPTLKLRKVRAIKKIRQHLQGWRSGVMVAGSITSIIFLLNLATAIAAFSKSGAQYGASALFEGSCEVVDHWSLALHVIINAVSSLLLGASNYTMQVLNAPTRSECDAAHARLDWFDIGIPSLRNLIRVTWPRKLLWLVLLVSSFPLHLLYNSAVFKTIGSNAYTSVLAAPQFLENNETLPPPPSLSGRPEAQSLGGSDHWNVSREVRELYLASGAAFEELSVARCLKVYGTLFVTDYSELILLTPKLSPKNTSVWWTHSMRMNQLWGFSSFEWMCTDYGDRTCNPASLDSKTQRWTVFNQTIEYCLARKVEPRCKLQVSTYILAFVTVCSFLKSAAMFRTLRLQRERPLVTAGDAIASWLDQPDEATSNRCLISAKDLANQRKANLRAGRWLHGFGVQPPIPFQHGLVVRWYQSVKVAGLAMLFTLSLLTIVVAGILGCYGYSAMKTNENPIQATGFGTFAPTALIAFQSSFSGFMTYVVVANIPQLIFSFLYFLYNGIITSMCLALEYSSYAVKRKPLRVTTPQGQQRSTRWLNLPYIFGVPLLAVSATLHWTISQSLFFIGIEVYGIGDPEPLYTHIGLAYSLAPIICDIVLGSCMLLALIGLLRRRLSDSKIPLAASNSLAISAACHRPEGDSDAATKSVMWGEVETTRLRTWRRFGEPAGSEVGHCTFTSMEVTTPVDGKLYAGS